jgi:hypothetical protein
MSLRRLTKIFNTCKATACSRIRSLTLRREVASKFKGLESDTCPFANLPEKKRTQWALTREEMKNCVWLKPELIAQVEFTEMDAGRSPEAFKVCRVERR